MTNPSQSAPGVAETVGLDNLKFFFERLAGTTSQLGLSLPTLGSLPVLQYDEDGNEASEPQPLYQLYDCCWSWPGEMLRWHGAFYAPRVVAEIEGQSGELVIYGAMEGSWGKIAHKFYRRPHYKDKQKTMLTPGDFTVEEVTIESILADPGVEVDKFAESFRKAVEFARCGIQETLDKLEDKEKVSLSLRAYILDCMEALDRELASQ